jgi:hypothetical protein
MFHEGTAKLNPDESWHYKMFFLWKECNTPPWEWTGDPRRYPEDVTAFMKMCEFDASGHKHRQAKAERKAQGRRGRGAGVG